MFRRIANLALSIERDTGRYPKLKYVMDNYKYFTPLHPLPKFDNREAINKYIDYITEEVKEYNLSVEHKLELADEILLTQLRAKRMSTANRLVFNDYEISTDNEICYLRLGGLAFKGTVYGIIAFYISPPFVLIPFITTLAQLLIMDDLDEVGSLVNKVTHLRIGGKLPKYNAKNERTHKGIHEKMQKTTTEIS